MPPAAFSPFCLTHVQDVRSVRQNSSGLAGELFEHSLSTVLRSLLEHFWVIGMKYSTAPKEIFLI
jgi:hypothetical protein